jgi:hypothetical protein
LNYAHAFYHSFAIPLLDDALLGVNWISVSHIAHATLEVHILFILSYVLIYLNQVESEAYYQVSVLH